MRAGTLSPAVVWHDVECGSYSADLGLWEGLAREAGGRVLDLGCGTGRVALRLAAAGVAVTAIDRDAELLGELDRRAAAAGVDVATVRADVRELSLGDRFALILAPMQLVELLGGPGERGAMLATASAHLAQGGCLAAAILAGDAPVEGDPSGVPDVREVDGWIYSSLPLEVRRAGDALEVRRLRQVVSPAGDLDEEVEATRLALVDVDELEAEAAAAGLRPAGRTEIPATGEHVGSTVVVLEADRPRTEA